MLRAIPIPIQTSNCTAEFKKTEEILPSSTTSLLLFKYDATKNTERKPAEIMNKILPVKIAIFYRI